MARPLDRIYPQSSFNTWVEYKLEQKCNNSSLSKDGLYTPADIINEINGKLKTKYTVQRLYDWRSRELRTAPDLIINTFVNPELAQAISWYFVKKGYFNTGIDTNDLASALSIPSKLNNGA